MKIGASLALLLVFCVWLPVLAQTKPTTPNPPQKRSDDNDDVVRITTNLVQIDAAVTKDGRPVRNLTVDDFEIFEDGRRQTITSFAYISNVPDMASQPGGSGPVREKGKEGVPFPPLKRNDPRRTIALVVDDLGLSAESMSHVRNQLRKFVAEKLQPNDLVAIIRTSGELGALQQFTNDKRLLNRAVDQLRWNICSRIGVHVLPPVGSMPFDTGAHTRCGFRSSNTMSSLRFILDAMFELPGRKSLVLLSDSLLADETQEVNFDENSVIRFPGSHTTFNYSHLLQRIAEKAIRSSVVIYSVDTQGLQYTGITAADSFRGSYRDINHQMQSLLSSRSQLLWNRRQGGELISRQTGGFQVRNSNSFGLDRILEDQTGYYLLGYRPTDETFNKRFHHINAKLKRSGMTLRTRFGFFGVSEEEATRPPLSTRDRTNLALTSPFGAQDVDLNMTSFFANANPAGSIIRSFVYIDAQHLSFTEQNGRLNAAIELHGVIFGDNGSVVEKISHGSTLSLSESDYEKAKSNGIGLSMDLVVKRPGSYQVRVAARDKATSRIGSAGQFVVVPNLSNKRIAVSGIVLGTGPESSGTSGNKSQTMAKPGVRRFATNSNLNFAFMIYNAAPDNAPRARNLVMETKLFRDGRIVHSAPEVGIDSTSQPDPNRLLVNGMVKLSADFEPGNYYLQIVITEKGAKKKTAPVVQWIDFDLVK